MYAYNKGGINITRTATALVQRTLRSPFCWTFVEGRRGKKTWEECSICQGQLLEGAHHLIYVFLPSPLAEHPLRPLVFLLFSPRAFHFIRLNYLTR